jgi:hypothetical protein
MDLDTQDKKESSLSWPQHANLNFEHSYSWTMMPAAT